jgi:hypothetical protein
MKVFFQKSVKMITQFQTFQSGLNETQEGANGLIGATSAP